MINLDSFLRQLDIIHPDTLTLPVTIIGAGGIGSWTSLLLGKLGCSNVTVYDFDKVEIQNVGSQIYTRDDIGQTKVDALRHTLEGLLEIPPATFQGRVTKKNSDTFFEHPAIVISAVDDIDVRRMMFEAMKGRNIIYIDGRMAADAIQVLTIPMNNPLAVAHYEGSLFPKSEADPAPCTAQAVVYNCFVIAGIIGSVVAKVAQNQVAPLEVEIDLRNYDLYQERAK